MAWWDELVSWGQKAAEYVAPAAETAWNFAKENPTLTGAGLGLITGGGTGDYGSNNFRNAAVGGALGYTAGQMFGTPTQAAAGMAPKVGGSTGPSWTPSSTSTMVGNTVSNASPVSGAAQYFGAGVGDVGDFSGVGSTMVSGGAGGAAGLGDTVQGWMKKASDFGKTYEMPIKVGMQGAAILEKRQRVKDTENMLRGQADQEAAYNAENRRVIDDSNAAERAYSVRAPQDAYANVMGATARKVREAGMDPNQTATQSAARKRSLSLQGTAGATTAAANAQRQPKLQQYGAPSNSAAIAAANYGGAADSSLWQDYASLGQTALGWDEKARKQVNP